MLESDIQKKIIAYLNNLPNCYCFKVIKANKRGVPDICCCLQGKAVFFEVKRQGAKPTPLQAFSLHSIADSGGECFVVYSLDEVKAAIDKVAKK